MDLRDSFRAHSQEIDGGRPLSRGSWSHPGEASAVWLGYIRRLGGSQEGLLRSDRILTD